MTVTKRNVGKLSVVYCVKYIQVIMTDGWPDKSNMSADVENSKYKADS